MPQKTNLNINPYFDDFDKNDNYYKVLFKPGFPVQSRELTTLQSILQNQIESFGSHIFKEGSMVIPGSVTYDNRFFGIKINPQHLGIDVTVYLDRLIGKKVKGEKSQILASIKKYSLPPEDGVDEITVYIKYLNSGVQENEALDSQQSEFPAGEVLLLEENVTYGNTTLNAGDTILTLVDTDPNTIGSAVGITDGVYFVRGTFIDVSKQQIVLEPYSILPSYRVGLFINEEIVTASDDKDLNDNARGFSNYAAPGADRFKITLTLGKKNLNDDKDVNFVEVMRVDKGEVKKLQDRSVYSEIQKYFAKRTYEESGNYAIDSFVVDALECLNDEVSSDGIYTNGQITESNNVPSENLLSIRVSPGKAYVKGFDVELAGSRVIDVEKSRDTETVESALVPFEMGSLLRVNNVYGAPLVGLRNTNTISLHNRRRNTSTTNAGTGTKIGEARVYAYNVTDASYANATTSWDLYLYDIQTYTEIYTSGVIAPLAAPLTSYVRGQSSGATGYIAERNGNTLRLNQTSGTFIQGEQLIFNDNVNVSCSVVSIVTYTIDDVKSVYQDSTSLDARLKTDFIADTILFRALPTGFNLTDRVTITSGGSITSPGKTFVGIKTDSIIAYQKAGASSLTYNRVSAISADGATLTVVPLDSSVGGVADGTLPGSTETTTFSLGLPKMLGVNNASLYTPLPENNIASIDFSRSDLVVTKQIYELQTNPSGQLTTPISVSNVGITSAFFEPFDAEKYSIHYSNGTTEPLTSSQFILGPNGGSINFTGLQISQSDVTVTATLRRKTITSKTKDFIRSSKLIVNGTAGVGSTAVSGLTTSNFYGLRVEDREISLNIPDVVNVIAVYQSTTANAPTLDKLTFVSGLGLDNNTILGERLVGNRSRAVAQLVTRVSSTEVEFVYLNSNKFQVGETITFEESNIASNVQSITNGSYTNLTSNYSLDKGQKDQYYDYSKIVRIEGGVVPSKQLLVIFNNYIVSPGNSGEVFTAQSYTKDRYKKDIPLLSGGRIRATDTIDIRPRVTPFNPVVTSGSPFAFSSRSFESNIDYIIAPNESSLMGYSFYLPRTDKLTISKFGEVSVIKGTSSINPKPPLNVDDVMDIAEIYLPPYIYDVKQIGFRLFDNRRFTMRDIASLESRIKNLEKATSLSLLELDTKTLQIQDADGLTRFKTGFVVDNFKNMDLIDTKNPDNKCDVNAERSELLNAVDNWSMGAELALDPSINPASTDIVDRTLNLPLLDPNIQKTGDLLTLKYTEVGWLEQPLASQVENVNPFNVIEFAGGILLFPASDNWVRTIYIDNTRTESTGAEWVERSKSSTDVQERVVNGRTERVTTETTVFENVLEGPSREFDYVESVRVNGVADEYQRSRNISYLASGLRPQTVHYHYFDNQVLDFCAKLIEIEMISGTFQVGELARAHLNGQLIMRFPVPPPKHKTGPFDDPDQMYTVDPYDRTRPAPGTSYSSSSKLLNIGVRAMAEHGLTQDVGGFMVVGAIINGETSGAIARCTRNELISDNFGDIMGTIFIRDPNENPTPSVRIKTGQRTFRLSATNQTNPKPWSSVGIPGSVKNESNASSIFSSSGTIITQDTSSVSVRNPAKPADRAPNIRQTIEDITPPARRAGGKDPLAQSFTVDETGAFLTGAEVYFASKDPAARLFVELRTVELGLPTSTLVQDYARIALEPSQIKTSTDASVPTRITFPAPIYLEARREYALVFLAPTSDEFEMWVATMGQKTKRTSNLPDAQSVVVSQPYSGGSLFKSQNGTVWTPSQYQDLTFKLFKAQFVTNGTATFYNTPINPGNINCQRLINNPIKTLPRKLKVGVTGIGAFSSILTPGRKVGYGNISGSSATGIIERIGSSVASSNGLTLVSVGTGFAGSQTYNNVPLYSISGNGSGATATIVTTSSGTVSSVTVTGGTRGNGYVIGEVLGITTTNTGGRGSGAVVSVSGIDGTADTLYLTNVQGESFPSGQTLVYYAGDTRTTTTASVNVTSTLIDQMYSGNVIEITQYNHGMHNPINKVSIQNIEPDTTSTTTTSDFSATATVINVSSTVPFTTFEGIGNTTRGHALIENEVVEYTNIGTGTLQIASRGVDGTSIIPHPLGSQIRPYEINGISLRRINKTHDLPTDQLLVASKTTDKYYLSIDRGNRSSGFNLLNFIDTKSVGGSTAGISQNHQFSSIKPQFTIITPGEGVSVSSQVRTISGTSAGGSEVSFLDNGYTPVIINSTTFFPTPRLVASRVNELERLTTLPRNKSLTFKLDFTSGDKNLSPVLDLSTASFVLSRNRLNKPILNYAIDSRSNNLSGDPHSSVYITKRINLSQSATSLKVLMGACRPADTDFRVLYRLFTADSSEVSQSYNLFPGYTNLRDTDNDGYGDVIINASLNNGLPDAFVRPSKVNEFLEYQFSVNNLQPFNGFVIKIVMSSTNECSQVKLSDFRAIALA